MIRVYQDDELQFEKENPAVDEYERVIVRASHHSGEELDGFIRNIHIDSGERTILLKYRGSKRKGLGRNILI